MHASSNTLCLVQWGTMEYHRRSLANLSTAMQRTRRLCSVWLDTTGREMVIRRPVTYDESGWPWVDKETQLKAVKGQVGRRRDVMPLGKELCGGGGGRVGCRTVSCHPHMPEVEPCLGMRTCML